jgi:hypothetical protein
MQIRIPVLLKRDSVGSTAHIVPFSSDFGGELGQMVIMVLLNSILLSSSVEFVNAALPSDDISVCDAGHALSTQFRVPVSHQQQAVEYCLAEVALIIY